MPHTYQNGKSRSEIEKLPDRLKPHMFTPIAPLEITAFRTPEPADFAQKETGQELRLSEGDKWGDLWDCAWFRFRGRVPDEYQNRGVVLLIDINGEACAVDRDGNPLRGLTSLSSVFDRSLGKPRKRVLWNEDQFRQGNEILLWADAGCNDLFGGLQENGTIKEARIGVENLETRALYYDVEVLLNLAGNLPENSARHQRILYALYRAMLLLGRISEETAKEARAILAPELAKRGGTPSLAVSAVGHAHIDLAWLWPIRETIRKGARTFSTVLDMMERYPDFHFAASQPQLYQWMKDRYPALYERIKERIREGRWEPIGATWVEADANLSGGEALVRQILYGKRFFRAEFGVEVRDLFLPDAFGFSAALPQLMRKAGVERFTTTKLSWDHFNQYPHHSFIWRGLDGSEVLAHMPPEGTYNSAALPESVLRAEHAYADKGVADTCLLLFGIGDGGGGPGPEHLERLARLKDLGGMPPVRQESLSAFFDGLAPRKEELARWSGEMFPHAHQGTYTTQGKVKRGNRKCEQALRDLECLAVHASLLSGFRYPAAELEAMWKEVLLYQFHDILPGSSITRVYDECLAGYEKILTRTEELITVAAQALADSLGTGGKERGAVVLNTLSWPRREWIQVEGDWLLAQAPGMGCAVADVPQEAPSGLRIAADERRLENELLAVTLNPDGTLSSVFDKEHNREVLEPGTRGNLLSVYDDPGDAWDFPSFTSETQADEMRLESSQSLVDGPRGIIRHKWVLGRSTLHQDIVLTAGSRRLDFISRLEWREDNRMLRTSFHVDVRADYSTSDIQFGSVRRPTHANTTWEQGKYEQYAHKWVDLSECGYGAALLNDCKYGHRLKDNVLDLHLVRSPSYPDPKADRGTHVFTYALYPHGGDHTAGGVNRAAYELNIPLRAMRMSAAPQAGRPAERILLSVDPPNVVIEAVKKAEEGRDIIARLYEAAGQRCEARLRIGFEHGSVFLVNLLEEQAQPLPANADAVRIPFHPFEIQTVRIALGAQGANPRIIFEEWDRVQKEAGVLSRGPNQKPWQPAG